jgi:hypothetical protein
VGAVLAALLASMTVLMAAPSAQAYPDDVCVYSVQPQRLVGGSPITVTGKSTVSRTWVVRLDDKPAAGATRLDRTAARDAFTPQTATGTGTTFKHTFTTPKVSKQRTLYVHCNCDNGAEQVFEVTILPTAVAQGGAVAPDHNGILPGTGGPALWILLLALALVLVGFGIVDVRRRNRVNPWDTATF